MSLGEKTAQKGGKIEELEKGKRSGRCRRGRAGEALLEIRLTKHRKAFRVHVVEMEGLSRFLTHEFLLSS